MSFWSWLWDMITSDFEGEPEPPEGFSPPLEEPPPVVEIGARPADSSGGMLATFTGGAPSGTLREGRKFLKPGSGDVLIEVEVKKPHFQITWYDGKDGPKDLGDFFDQEQELSWQEGQDFLSGWGGVTGQLPVVELVERELTLQQERVKKAGPSGGGLFDSFDLGAPADLGYHKRIDITVLEGKPYEGGLIIEEGAGHGCSFSTAPTGIEARAKVVRGSTRETKVTMPKGGWKWTEKGPELKYGGNMGKIIDKGNWTGEGTVVRVEVQPKSTYSKVIKLDAGKHHKLEVSQRWDIYVRKKKYKKWKYGGPILKYILKLYSYFSQKGEKAGIFGKAWKKWKDYLYSQ